MIKPILALLFIIQFYSTADFASAQNLPLTVLETGTPFLTNYTPSIYNSHGQNWAIVQDNDGFMYFGNTDGCVLQYDGVQWRQIPISNGSIVRSLARDSSGTIYVGAQNEIGYLAPDSSGTLTYISILHEIPKKYLGFGDIWQIHFIDNQLHFSTRKYLFRRNKDGSYKIWQAQNVFHASFNPGFNNLYIHQRNTGLMILEDDSLKLIPDGERFKEDWVYVITPFRDENILIASRNSGLYVFDGKQIVKFETPAENWLINNHVYHGTYLRSGQIVLGTQRSGLIVLDQNGNILNIIDKETGLQDDQIWHVFQDVSNCLWIALNKGISKIEYTSPWSSFKEANGLEGNVHDVVRHLGVLYAATGMGVYRLNRFDNKTKKSGFELLSGLKSQCWALLSLEDRLLVSCNHGIFEYRDEQFRQISQKSAWQFHISKKDPNRIYLGLDQGVSSLYLNRNQWMEEVKLPNINANARTLAEDSQGRLWVGTVYEGVYQIEFFDNTNTVKNINHFDKTDGLPGPNYNLVFPYGDEILFGTIGGVFYFNEEKQTFKPLPIINEYPPSDDSYAILSEFSKGNIWFNSGAKLIQLQKDEENQFSVRFKPFLRLPESSVHCIYPEENGTIWLGGPDGIYRYDPTVEENINQKFSTHIRRVLSFSDSIIFDGTGLRSMVKPILPFSSKAIRFEFAAPYFIKEDQTAYRFQLVEFDSEWSNWTYETKKDYTNIPEGNYTFLAESINLYGEKSSTVAFPFEIQAPMYRRWWAYLIYITITTLIIVFILRRLLTYTRKKAMLEQQKIEDTQRKIEEDLRSQLAADFHDELGTQITRISLFSEILKNDLVDVSDHAKAYLQKISQNADDLYSETRDFIWQLDPKSDTLMDFISRMRSFANDLFEESNINFDLKNNISDAEKIKLPMDTRRNLIRIFKEALHNAFKYAQCKNVVFELAKKYDEFVFILSDDGIGFETTKKTDGNGLMNMNKRAQKIIGKLQIDSCPQTGTQIKLSVKI